jgi:hypothetical protein
MKLYLFLSSVTRVPTQLISEKERISVARLETAAPGTVLILRKFNIISGNKNTKISNEKCTKLKYYKGTREAIYV